MRERRPSQPFYNLVTHAMIVILVSMIVKLHYRIEQLERASGLSSDIANSPMEWFIFVAALVLIGLSVREFFRSWK